MKAPMTAPAMAFDLLEFRLLTFDSLLHISLTRTPKILPVQVRANDRTAALVAL
jgi:hypothetical protein